MVTTGTVAPVYGSAAISHRNRSVTASLPAACSGLQGRGVPNEIRFREPSCLHWRHRQAMKLTSVARPPGRGRAGLRPDDAAAVGGRASRPEPEASATGSWPRGSASAGSAFHEGHGCSRNPSAFQSHEGKDGVRQTTGGMTLRLNRLHSERAPGRDGRLTATSGGASGPRARVDGGHPRRRAPADVASPRAAFRRSSACLAASSLRAYRPRLYASQREWGSGDRTLGTRRTGARSYPGTQAASIDLPRPWTWFVYGGLAGHLPTTSGPSSDELVSSTPGCSPIRQRSHIVSRLAKGD